MTTAQAQETTCGHSPHMAKGLCNRCYLAAYYAANKAAAQAKRREYHKAHAAANVERARRWREANPERFQALRAANRARQVTAEMTLTPEQWIEMLAAAEGHCTYCGRTDQPLTIDHMIPLSRGGPHTAENVTPACRSCNASKRNRTALEFAAWRGEK